MDTTYALKLIQEALAPNVEATDLFTNAHPSGERLRVLINDGPSWYEIELAVKSAQDVTADDERDVVKEHGYCDCGECIGLPKYDQDASQRLDNGSARVYDKTTGEYLGNA